MKRDAMEKLTAWKESREKKPLLLRGARKSGKTWLLKEFGRLHYENTAYFDFGGCQGLERLTETAGDPRGIIQSLALISGVKIRPGPTLVVFDGAERRPAEAESLMRLFARMPEYHAAFAETPAGRENPGAVFPEESACPVGLGPMTFREFLESDGETELAARLSETGALSPVPSADFSKAGEKLKEYFFTGGFPFAVRRWTETHDAADADRALSETVHAFERDFAEHDFRKCALIWRSVPRQLARENKKFTYRAVKEGARAREYGEALRYLTETGVLSKVGRLGDPGAFKLFFPDTGLLRREARIRPEALSEGETLFSALSGGLAENFVLQELTALSGETPSCWSENNPPHEVSFLLKRGDRVFPAEVAPVRRPGVPGGLKRFQKLFPDTDFGIRYSLGNLRFEKNVLEIPLFMADQTERLIGLALKKA